MITSTPVVEQHVHPTSEQLTCLNCDHAYVGQYCSQCGQQADTHRINWRYLWHEISESMWGVDRGILFTLRELFTRPGYSIREFLAGRRINHYRPLALLLMLGAIYLFVSQSLDIDVLKKSQGMYGNVGAQAGSQVQTKEVLTKFYQFLDENQQFGDLIMVPFVAFWCWRLFRRSGYNYPEMLVAQTFIANFGLFVSLIMLLAVWMLGDSSAVMTGVMSVSVLIPIAYNVFTYTQLLKGKLKPLSIVLRSVSAYLLGYLSLMLFGGLIVFVYTIVFFINADHNKALPKKAAHATSQHARL